MAEDLTYSLYDTAAFGTSAATTHTLFQVSEGGDSTHVSDYTNMIGNGALPANYHFKCKRIRAFAEQDVALAELVKIMNGSYLEIVVADRSKLQIPLALAGCRRGIEGFYTQATGADAAAIGMAGDGFDLDIPIDLPGGTNFQVKVYQKLATAATENVKVVLDGILTRPS